MNKPVNDAKEESSKYIRPCTADNDRNFRNMYTIHYFHGQPEDNSVDNDRKKPHRHNKKRERQKLHERFNQNIQKPYDKTSYNKKLQSTGIMNVRQ